LTKKWFAGMPPQKQDKRSCVDSMLAQSMILLMIDSQHEDVDIPVYLKNDIQLRINISHHFAHPPKLTEWGIEATLTFGDVPYPCRIPWHAIYGVVPHDTRKTVFFPESMPETLRESNARAQQALADNAFYPAGQPAQQAQAQSSSATPTIRLVDSPHAHSSDVASSEPVAEPQPDPAATAEEEPKPAKKSRSHLRLVK